VIDAEPVAEAGLPWADAVRAAALLAVDPAGCVGVVVRGLPGPIRERWVAALRSLLAARASWRRVPLHVVDARLLGGLDLAATLHAGRPVAERGLLVEADGGVVELSMAERLAPSVAGRLCQVLDAGEVALERDGLGLRTPARFAVVALDEGLGDDEATPASLRDRLAFRVELSGLRLRDAEGTLPSAQAVAEARARLAGVSTDDAIAAALCEAAGVLGIRSLRAPMLALRAARAAAALAGRDTVSGEDAALAARLVLAPRAETFPTAEEEPPEPDAADPERDTRPAEDAPEEEAAQEPDERGAQAPAGPPGDEPPEPGQAPELDDDPLSERVVAAARAALPRGLLTALRAPDADRRRPGAAGRAGARQRASMRGRPAGVRPGDPRSGARLDLVATLRAAAPWQPVRRRDAAAARRVAVRRDDFRVKRFRQRAETTTIFAVDASGSTALQRLGEAKGAVELLLAECYVRRDRVALVSFRGHDADLLLPPTRSLVRARRSLAGLPGGGGTPLAAGIAAAGRLAGEVLRRGGTPVVVLLTDGRANVARDGTTGRVRAGEDATAAAQALRQDALRVLLVDTSPRPQAAARGLADTLGAEYVPLPHANAAALCGAVRKASAAER